MGGRGREVEDDGEDVEKWREERATLGQHRHVLAVCRRATLFTAAFEYVDAHDAIRPDVCIVLANGSSSEELIHTVTVNCPANRLRMMNENDDQTLSVGLTVAVKMKRSVH